MIATKKTKSNGRAFVFGAAVAVIGLLFLLFVYGYPQLFPAIEATRPGRFETIVADALAAGDVDRAVLVGRRESEGRPNDPAAHTAYGRALLAAGRPEEALAVLERAVHVCRDVHGRLTHKPFYFEPARLTLGRYYLAEGRADEAVRQFELARAYATLNDEKYQDFHEDLYQAYAGQQLWARALQFRHPAEQELDALDGRSLVLLARVCEGNEDWALAERVAQRLVAQDAAEADYVLGRAELARGQYPAAAVRLQRAADAGRLHAAFFLGAAFEKLGETDNAIRAYAGALPDDVYRPFALAKTQALSAGRPEAQTYEAEFEAEVDALRQSEPPALDYLYPRFVPLGFSVSRAYAQAGAAFPILILWKHNSAALARKPDSAVSESEGRLTVQPSADTVLQLQWVTNRINWAGVDLAGPDTLEAPGWIDTARDWFGLRDETVAQIVHGPNNYLNLAKMTWFYSVPVAARHGIGYLVTARMSGPKDKTGIGWQGINKNEDVLGEGQVRNQGSSDAWTTAAVYVRSELAWDRMRLQLLTSPDAGNALFDDVTLLEIVEPESSS